MNVADEHMKHYYRDLFDSIPEYWDEIYGTDSFYGHHYRCRRDRIERLLRTKEFSSGDVILDIGCGAGGYFPVYLDMGLSVVGIDVAKGMTEQAESIYSREVEAGRVKVGTGDIESLEWDDNSFDAVNCAGVLMYLPDTTTALSEIYRVLKPGGVATLNSDNHRTLSAIFDVPKMIRLMKRKIKTGGKPKSEVLSETDGSGSDNDEPLTKAYAPADFRRKVESAGFEITAEAGHGFDRIRFNGEPVFSDRVNTRLYKILDPLYRLRPIGRMGMTYTLLARK